ncbi:OLC1v1011273C1 [Oldenlandia corymbosa var. corymbosa]|uniref:OLC1v1011273C1 n=1 Tax=Oldenlandia corymbosa var. corymbosa TaxID=529605 RepID=A0AAV1DTC0_OLDCO|nr:OLC1v1011273C1 [Oldenlandia corymbosa var. corymbosa]
MLFKFNAEDNVKEVDGYGRGGCRYGCCGWYHGHCGKCCKTAEEAKAAEMNSFGTDGYGGRYGGGYRGGHCKYGCCGGHGRYCRCCYTPEEAQAVQFGN